MPHKNNSTKTSIIISAYKDHVALDLILMALNKQSTSNFEIIVSEDGQCDEIERIVDKWSPGINNIIHLNQKDDGFRKNRALNRAIKNSSSDHLVFIDGDCIPHPMFVAAHQTCEGPGKVCAGRRVELGPSASDDIRSGTLPLEHLFSSLSYLLLLPRLLKDNVEHPGLGISAKYLQNFTLNRPIKILGCNFSCNKQDLYKINGFNEDFIAAGWGEDSDIEWRLKQTGVKIYNVKFTAIQYHLYHPRWYELDDNNRQILEDSIESNTYYCKNGLSKRIAELGNSIVD